MESLESILAIQQQLFQVYEQFSMLEQSVVCKLVPKSIADIQMTSDKMQGNMDSMDVKAQNKRLKEAKRWRLDELIQDYEKQLSTIELRYQHVLTTFCNSQSSACSATKQSPLTRLVKKYVLHRFNQFKRENRFNMIIFRTKLYRRRKRHWKAKQKQLIDVYPQTIVDVPILPLSETDLFYLSSTGHR